MGMPKGTATLMVFLLSAIMHEALISVPFHMIRPWSFIGMIMQIPLVGFTKYLWKKMPRDTTRLPNVVGRRKSKNFKMNRRQILRKQSSMTPSKQAKC
jgi:hypothetical protein